MQYIKDGKVKRNPEGKIVLPSGIFIPRAIPGITFCDRINEYYKRNPTQAAPANQTSQMMYAVGPAAVTEIFSLQTGGINAQATHISSDQENNRTYIAKLEREILALRRKQVFDGVEINRRQPAPRPTPETTAVPAAPAPVPANVAPPAASVA